MSIHWMPGIIYCCWVVFLVGWFHFFFIPLCSKSSHSVQINQMFLLISSWCASKFEMLWVTVSRFWSGNHGVNSANWNVSRRSLKIKHIIEMLWYTCRKFRSNSSFTSTVCIFWCIQLCLHNVWRKKSKFFLHVCFTNEICKIELIRNKAS